MSDEPDLEQQLRRRLQNDLGRITPSPGGEQRLYRDMNELSRPSWLRRIQVSGLAVPIAAAVVVVALLVIVPMTMKVVDQGIQPAGRPRSTPGCAGVPAGDSTYELPETLSPSEPFSAPTHGRRADESSQPFACPPADAGEPASPLDQQP